MKCKNCGFEFDDIFKYCPDCATKNPIFENENRNSNVDINGNNNKLIGVNNNGTQKINIIDKVENYNANDSIDKIISYEFYPVGELMGGEKGFLLKAKIMSFLSALSGIITIVAWLINPESGIHKFLILAVFAFIIFAFSFYDNQKTIDKKMVVKKDELTIYKLEEKNIVKYCKMGICPICQGRVNIKVDKKLNKNIGICVNNSDHIFSYDYTINKGKLLEELVLESYKLK